MEINWRATRLKTEKNTIVIIPNSIMSTLPVTNYWNSGMRTRFDITFCIDFSVPIERVSHILTTAVKEVISQPGFIDSVSPEVFVDGTSELGVEYCVRYWITPWRILAPAKARDIVSSSVLRHLSNAGISLAYPKEDIYYEKMPARHLDAAQPEDRLNILSRVELFSHLQTRELQTLAKNASYRFFREKDIIIQTGDIGNSMFVLIEGLVDVKLPKPDDEEKVKVAQLRPGDFFGEMSILTGEPRSADVVANTDVVAYELPGEQIRDIFSSRPEIVEKVSQMLVERKYQNYSILEESLVDTPIVATNNPNLLVEKIRSFFSKTNLKVS
jgi:CRP-like cAMP-binding protein